MQTIVIQKASLVAEQIDSGDCQFAHNTGSYIFRTDIRLPDEPSKVTPLYFGKLPLGVMGFTLNKDLALHQDAHPPAYQKMRKWMEMFVSFGPVPFHDPVFEEKERQAFLSMKESTQGILAFFTHRCVG